MPESENTETPPVEIPEIAKTPDKAPEISAPDPATYKKKLDQLYWLRIIFAAASGIIATFAFDSIDGEERRWASIIFMIAVYLVTFVIAKSMKMQLPASDKKKIITQAIGSFVFIYLFMWIVSYTLVNIPSAGFDLGTSLYFQILAHRLGFFLFEFCQLNYKRGFFQPRLKSLSACAVF